MVIVAHISRQGVPIADVTYRSGMHVEVRVAQEFQEEEIFFSLAHSENKELKGRWEEAIDNYFNEGRFDSREHLLPGEIARIGTAREHKSLFRQAAHALWKDLEPLGYKVEVEFI
jgi:hypothetical protein